MNSWVMKMIKLLIVDDEQPILDGLKVIIDWKYMDVDIIGTANNGQEAMDIALELRPDLVITDVRMPIMGGLNLIKKLKESLPDTKCVILSGYQEFEYVKEAMKYGALGYLIKPIDENELKNIIINIRDALITASKEKKKLESLNEKLVESYPYIRNKLLYRIVSGEVRNLNVIKKKLEYYGINSFPKQYICFIVEFEILDASNSISEEDTELMRFAVANIVNEIVTNKTEGFIFYLMETKVIALISVANGQEYLIETLLKDVLHYMPNFLKTPVTIGVSNIYSGFENIALSFKEAKSALKYKLLTGKGKIIYYRDVTSNMGNTFSISVKIEKKLVNCIICYDEKSIPLVVEEIFAEFTQNASIYPEEIITTCKDILLLISRSVEEMGIDVKKIILFKNKFDDETVNMSISELKSYFISVLMEIKSEINRCNSKGAIAIVAQIKEYINQNYSSQITLNTIAEKFYINSSYVSRLFKKESTENFIDYLTNKRIDEAKKFLSSSDMKVYEISEKVGYNNPKYFSQLFEKTLAMTPREYRNLNRK